MLISVTSFYFFLLLIAGVLLYYIVPKRIQWVVLLGLSIIYYYNAATFYTIIYLIISSLVAYVSTMLMERNKSQSGNKRIVLWLALAAVFINIAVWFVFKGSSFWISGSKVLHSLIPNLPVLKPMPLASALGMGYYTSQVIGYILDVYWDKIKPQHNPIKLFLFVCFFPQLTVGPISRYDDLKVLYEPHRISYQNLSFGCQRIVWGLFKKLVISDRVGIIVSGIWANTSTYQGIWLWVAVLLYPIQIYTDFSGCMDIVLGAAELFDIHLAENFRNPFFARNSQEFWQRWHITLGTWARDYIYYPVLKSKALVSLGRITKKRFGKKVGKLIPWMLGMGVLWFVMGFWHGSTRHIVGVSLWFWCMLVLSELFKPIFDVVTEILKIKTEAFSWHFFQSVRTYFVYAIGAVAFSAEGLKAALKHYRLLLGSFEKWNPWVLFDSSILKLGVSWYDINLILIGILMLIIVAILREKHQYARLWFQRQNIVFRWIVWIVLFFSVVICGLYGEGYDASTFIYQGF